MKKIAVITGGSSGVGFSFAKCLGNKAYTIIILARNENKINQAIEQLTQQNIEAEGIICDVTSQTQIINAKKIIESKHQKIDFLILNAGIVTVKLLKDYSNTQELRNDIETDLWGVIQSAYYFESLLIEKSKVLIISSALGIFGIAGYSTYCAAKAGVINFAEAWRRELISKKINVYVACPSDIDTQQYRNEIKSHPQWMKQKQTPRKPSSPDDVAKKIIKKCKGNLRFLIFPTTDVKFLYFINKILPRPLRDFLIDKIFPKP